MNTYTTYFQDEPTVAATPGGAFVVVWSGTDSHLRSDVFGQRYLAPDLIFRDGFQ